jgi:hypothetical protein
MQIFQLHNLTAQRLGGDALHRLGSLTGALQRPALGLLPPRYASSLDAEFVQYVLLVSPARSSPPPSRASSTAAAASVGSSERGARGQEGSADESSGRGIE